MGKVLSVGHCSVVFVQKEQEKYNHKRHILEEARVFCCRLLWLYRPTPSSVTCQREETLTER